MISILPGTAGNMLFTWKKEPIRWQILSSLMPTCFDSAPDGAAYLGFTGEPCFSVHRSLWAVRSASLKNRTGTKLVSTLGVGNTRDIALGLRPRAISRVFPPPRALTYTRYLPLQRRRTINTGRALTELAAVPQAAVRGLCARR